MFCPSGELAEFDIAKSTNIAGMNISFVLRKSGGSFALPSAFATDVLPCVDCYVKVSVSEI